MYGREDSFREFDNIANSNWDNRQRTDKSTYQVAFVVGASGMGKTSFGWEIARRYSYDRKDYVVSFIDLSNGDCEDCPMDRVIKRVLIRERAQEAWFALRVLTRGIWDVPPKDLLPPEHAEDFVRCLSLDNVVNTLCTLQGKPKVVILVDEYQKYPEQTLYGVSTELQYEDRKNYLQQWLNRCCGVMRAPGMQLTPLQQSDYCATWCFLGTASDCFRRNVTNYANVVFYLERLAVADAQAMLAPVFKESNLEGFEQTRPCRQLIARCGGVPRVLDLLREKIHRDRFSAPATASEIFGWLDSMALKITNDLYQVRFTHEAVCMFLRSAGRKHDRSTV